jgi:2,4-dienoyl-CoA reductase-like NADH-dependent reductase (Old Yellow Enzyme family)/thioredoxin reductase
MLSPLAVGNVLMKNRLLSSAATPHFMQGTETFPTEKWITLMANRARNGAAVVHINHLEHPHPGKSDIRLIDNTPDHFSTLDIGDPSTHNYLCQMIDAIRLYGSIAMTSPMGKQLRPRMDEPYTPKPGEGGPGSKPVCDELTKRDMQLHIDSVVEEAVLLKKLGFEMFSLHNAYRNGPVSQLLSPLCNHRTDEYGGSVENRARLLLDIFDALKQTLGQDFPLECLVSGEEVGGITIQDTIALARLAEGKIDLLTIRQGEQDPQHPIGFTSSRTAPCPNLAAAAAVKADVQARGGKLLVGVSAGLQSPELCDRIIREGQADVLCMARAFLCDSQYGEKIYAGRGEDVRPCIRCNKCHVPNDSDKFRSYCSVNPEIGLEDKLERLFPAVTTPKKLVVIGGGPAGMVAAITAAQLGHSVTLLEQNQKLGGQLLHADYADFKWPLEDYKNYLIRQLDKHGVQVQLGIAATPELVKSMHADAVFVAIGPKFKRPPLPGADGPNVKVPMEVFGCPESLPDSILIMGGSETAVETGMYLARCGKQVTLLSRQKMLASDAPHAHYISMLEHAYQTQPGFSWETEVQRYVSISQDGVSYVDRQGQLQMRQAGLVVCATGTAPQHDAAAAFYGTAPLVRFLGDCNRPGDVHKAVTAGWSAAKML